MLLFALALACGEKATEDSSVDTVDTVVEFPCFQGEPVLYIGEGASSFVEFGDSPTSMMIHGPQGGWHILASIRVENMSDILQVEYSIEHLDSGVIVSDNSYRLAIVPDGECSGYYPGLYGYLRVVDLYDGDLDTPPELLGGDILRIHIRVNDCGASLEESSACVQAERWVEGFVDVTAVLDPIDQ